MGSVRIHNVLVKVASTGSYNLPGMSVEVEYHGVGEEKCMCVCRRMGKGNEGKRDTKAY